MATLITTLLTHDLGYLMAGSWLLLVALAIVFSCALGKASARREAAARRAWKQHVTQERQTNGGQQ